MSPKITRQCNITILSIALMSVPVMAVPSLTMTTGLTVNRNTPFNLITNGSFEDGVNAPDATTPGKYWATGTTLSPFAVPPGWSSVGDTAAYAAWTYDTVGPYVYGSDVLPHGNRGLYFGNQFTSAISQPPTFNGATGVVTFPSPPTITPKGPGYLTPVQLSQTVTGLNTNAIYKFTFWTSGEAARFGGMQHDGIFALDVTGFSTLYLQAPAGAGADTVGASHVYEFYLQPASSTTTFQWTNWGHYGIGYTAGYNVSPMTDELVLDDVVLNFDRLVPEPASLLLVGIGGMAALRRRHAFRTTSIIGVLCLAGIGGLFAHIRTANASMSQNTGAQVATPTGNLVTNGSFETGAPAPGFANQVYWATGTTNTPFGVPPGWTSSGQAQTYALWGSGPGTGIQFSDVIPDGQAAVYFGNASTAVSPSPSFGPNHNVTFGSPPTFNPFYGGPCTLSQTVNTPATPAPSYALNFWVSGEDASTSVFAQQGVFGLKVTNVLPGDPIQYFAVPNSSSLPSYRLEFFFTPINPLSPVTIQFINWGHITAVPGSISPFDSTELVIDDVIINALPEPASLMLLCTSALFIRRRHRSFADGLLN